ncbi:hypothetical protein PNEG_03391 [Pneumocystis murina B123]|uniref:Mediator of RNA polymerase II transcription subunit 7 n=1 Tax=Pneumocystis murina (strain B123) TaxID=1069680 RepID=M7NLZ7_PNEMU|nr:hypothetical protein PNEG_03391 [Pneumocystis murina B123]EMR08222.2 hypothetical protein PNEG_03391 [Pneumocystis murina B123]
MQDSALETELSSTFPPPPRHYKLFTKENLDAFKEKKYDFIRDLDNLGVYDATNTCSPKLERFFTPPKAPTKGFYRCFHEQWKIPDELPSLSDFGIQELFDSSNGPLCAQKRVNELKKMLKSLLLNFLELVGIMSIAPEQFVEKVEHIRIILLNMHHLINEYRPHQARHTLCRLVEKQVQEEKEQLLACEDVCNDIKDTIHAYKSILEFNPDQQLSVE